MARNKSLKKVLYSLICIILYFNVVSVKAQNQGLAKKQDPLTLPKSRVAFQKAVPVKKFVAQTVLKKNAPGEYLITKGWEMIEASKVNFLPKRVSQEGINTSKWYNAVVPGTVLTTLVNQGVYSDPYFGVNNLSIPDTLCRQNWWYRTVFKIPASEKNKPCRLYFKGINYSAEIWLNGIKLGNLKGAFLRGFYDISTLVKPLGNNVLAVNITPPPHPGIPHEESPSAGTGPNGGQLCLDGPTFISSEGWDWIPGIRDRNIGIWQDVAIQFYGSLRLDDSQIITDLSLPDTSKANVFIKTELTNTSIKAITAKVSVRIEKISISQDVKLAAGQTKLVSFSPNDYPELHLKDPRLWWPNGYGNPNLYQAFISVTVNNKVSDSKIVRFGIRELSYELTVDDADKKEHRVEFNPLATYSKIKKPVFDNVNRRKYEGEVVVPSLNKGVDISALTELTEKDAAPYLVIKVNGKRIFCKGGNWGMDDGMKRVSRAHLEPYFKLSKNANFNMLRNWTGENTEELFYELCDEYGMLVWNDFWLSTEGYNLNPLDNKLFLDNAADVIKRFRNHPSIVIWCPRNEGYAPEGLEKELAQLVYENDGTRHYQGNSRYLNLRPSGPWHYLKDSKDYFTKIAEGFNTELGTPSIPEAATIRKMMAKEDTWPIGDVWYYHDFHEGQKEYVKAIDSLYGKAESLDDFSKKAQLINYDSHRAMFESWNSKMWNKTTGLLLWMTHPAWPSTVWQVYSSDYDTYGAYYASKKACEPVHIQMNLHDNKVIVCNTSLGTFKETVANLSLFDLSGNKIYQKELKKDIAENQVSYFFTPELPGVLPDIYLCRLTLTDKAGTVISHNDYWKTANGSDFKKLNQLPESKLEFKINDISNGNVSFTLTNTSDVICLGIKPAISNKGNGNILPAYFSDGYFNLLPGEVKQLSIAYDIKEKSAVKLMVRAYNFTEKEFSDNSFTLNK